MCWGDNAFGQTSVSPDVAYTDISAGRHHTCAVRKDGVALCWGQNRWRQIGDDHTLTLRALHDLTATFHRLGRDEEALPLVLELVDRTPDDDPDQEDRLQLLRSIEAALDG